MAYILTFQWRNRGIFMLGSNTISSRMVNDLIFFKKQQNALSHWCMLRHQLQSVTGWRLHGFFLWIYIVSSMEIGWEYDSNKWYQESFPCLKAALIQDFYESAVSPMLMYILCKWHLTAFVVKERCSVWFWALKNSTQKLAQKGDPGKTFLCLQAVACMQKFNVLQKVFGRFEGRKKDTGD